MLRHVEEGRTVSPLKPARCLVGALLVLALLTTLLGCHGAGDGGQGATDEFLNRGADVVPLPATTSTYVQLVEQGGTPTQVCIAVDAFRDRITNVYSASFSVTYDPALVHFNSFDDSATCLGGPSNRLPTQVNTDTPGLLIVGLTRDASVTTTGVTCGPLITLCFDIVGQGQFVMGFTGNLALLDPSNARLPVEWVSSTVRTRQ
jgi:hypothetical protein